MRSVIFIVLLGCTIAVQGQNSSSSNSSNSQVPAAPTPAANSQTPDSTPPSTSKIPMPGPNSAPPRSDHVDASSLGDDAGESSSKDTEIDLSPPAGDDKAHPNSGDALDDEGGVTETHPWDPHRAAKDIEVGDFYFKVKKNYRAAESRYREALYYKDKDATATYKLAVCLEKLERPDEALQEYENYLKILPYGSEAPKAKNAIERLKGPAAKSAPAK